MLSSTDHREPVQRGATTPPEMSAWARRLLFLRIILITVLLILLVAALLAYAVVPVIDLLHRFMPRALAMVLVYVLATVLLGAIAYLAVKTLIPQLNSLAQVSRRS